MSNFFWWTKSFFFFFSSFSLLFLFLTLYFWRLREISFEFNGVSFINIYPFRRIWLCGRQNIFFRIFLQFVVRSILVECIGISTARKFSSANCIYFHKASKRNCYNFWILRGGCFIKIKKFYFVSSVFVAAVCLHRRRQQNKKWEKQKREE